MIHLLYAASLTLTLFVTLSTGQIANTLDTYISSYCSDRFIDETTIQSVENCFDQAIGVNPIIARRCKSFERTPLERKRNRCAIKPIPSSLYSSLISQCYIKEATNTGDTQTVMQVKNVQSIMDSFNFLLIRGYMRSQAARLEMCLRNALQQRHPVGQLSPGPSMEPSQSMESVERPMTDGQFYGPTSRVRVRRQVYGPNYGGQPYGAPGYGGQQYGTPSYGPGPYAPYPDYGNGPNPSYPTSYDPYQPYYMGRYQRDYLWRQRRRQIDRDLRSLGYTR